MKISVIRKEIVISLRKQLLKRIIFRELWRKRKLNLNIRWKWKEIFLNIYIIVIKKCIIFSYKFKNTGKKVTGKHGETLGDRREDFYAREKKREMERTKRDYGNVVTREKELSSYNFEVRALRRKGWNSRFVSINHRRGSNLARQHRTSLVERTWHDGPNESSN